jgi:hypothetical protein
MGYNALVPEFYDSATCSSCISDCRDKGRSIDVFLPKRSVSLIYLVMALRPNPFRWKILSTTNELKHSSLVQRTVLTHFRNASRLSRRAAARTIPQEPYKLPENTPKTLSSWEKKPAVPPKKGYWKTAVILGYIGGPAVSEIYFLALFSLRRPIVRIVCMVDMEANCNLITALCRGLYRRYNHAPPKSDLASIERQPLHQ